MTTALNRFTNYTQSEKKPKDNMSFWTNVETHDDKAANNTFSDSEYDYDSQTEEGQMREAVQASLLTMTPKGVKRKAADTLEPTIDHIKRLASEDTALANRVKAFYDTLLDEKRKLIGDTICWQEEDDKANKAAMLASNINVIMQARKAIMSKDNEGIKIIIDQAGWNDDAHVRPKYAIRIERITDLE